MEHPEEDSIGRRILTWSKEIKGPLPRYHLYRILQNSLYSHDSIRVHLLFFSHFSDLIGTMEK